MTASLQQLIESWDGLAVVCRFDRPTGTWIFVALHDDTLGTPTGGTRIRVYERPEDGLIDAQRLAAGMTHKWAAIDLGYGGGKAVLALSRPVEGAERAGLFERYGRLLSSLRGGFSTGADMGTTPDDLLRLARQTGLVHGYDREADDLRDPGPYTARGVLAGMHAAAGHALGNDDLRGLTILLQGVGGVGLPLAHLLAREGVRIRIADVDEERARRVADEVGGTVVPADEVYDTECDIYAPCAVGATLNDGTLPRLRCRIVAGSANNQLAEARHAPALAKRGILYAPDYVINAGGAAALGSLTKGVTDEGKLLDAVDHLGVILSEIFEEAARRDESPAQIAERRVRRNLEAESGG